MRKLLNRIYNKLSRRTYDSLLSSYALTWKPYSRLILAGDTAGWVLDWEMREIGKIASKLGIRLAGRQWLDLSRNQAVFLSDQFFLLNDNWFTLSHRIAFPYYHGMPDTGVGGFDRAYAALCQHHERISRIQVSHSEMLKITLQTGIDPNKVFLIPIGVNLDFFSLQNKENRSLARRKLGIPQSAFVIGSFQKDGNGWGEGLEAKLVKGPDIFLSVIRRLKAQIPELFVLLSGPARGYMKAGLEAMQVPYSHVYLDSYPQIGELFKALDLYLVTARQEGGPKAILESMASGIPIISTRVGQAMDLIQHGQNGWLAEVEDSEAIAGWALHVRSLNDSTLAAILLCGRATAEMNSYTAQIPLWKKFMKGFVA